jgi:hypothetical protein
MGQYPEHLADRARRLASALPDAAVLDRYPSQQKPGIAQPREIRSDQLASLLSLGSLQGEIGRHCADIFMNRCGFHRAIL